MAAGRAERTMNRLRCRAGVWERGRWIRQYQCNNAAKGEMEMQVRSGKKVLLPTCGVHLRYPPMHAYWPNNPPWDSGVQEYVER